MTITKPAETTNTIQLPTVFNDCGEAILHNAPLTTLANGSNVVPQQFFHYVRTRENVEHIVSRIHFLEKLPIFVYEKNEQVLLQVGIVGHENYPPLDKDSLFDRNDKIVYGRKWYIEPHTPTSEVIQTAFLALQKVREHELRELLSIKICKNNKVHKSTPFNTHMDLPLMAKNADLFLEKNTVDNTNIQNKIVQLLQSLSLGNATLELIKLTHIVSNTWHVSIATSSLTSQFKYFFPELDNTLISFSLNTSQQPFASSFLHQLINTILNLSYQYLCENFTFDGFPRFSQKISPIDIAEFSIDTRVLKVQKDEVFTKTFKKMSQHVDGGKAPVLAKSEALKTLQTKAILKAHAIEGFLPDGI